VTYAAALPATAYPSDQRLPSSEAAPTSANDLAAAEAGLDAATILEAIATLSGKQTELSNFFNYYAGTATVPLVSERLQEIYRNLTFVISENWSAVVVDSTTDRIELLGAKGPDDEITRQLKEAIDEVELLIEADEAHQSAIIGGEAYVIAWKDPESGELECYFNDPRTCHIFYEPDRPNIPREAVKWWDGTDGKRHIKFYTTERIVEVSIPLGKEGKLSLSELEEVESAENPYGIIPVFHLRTKRRAAHSDLTNVMPLQDGINILLINMMVTAEFSAAPMKYVISNAEGIEDLVVAPNRVWNIPAGDGLPGTPGTQVGQFAASDLGNYLSAIAHGIDAISAISRTPRHYFYGSQLPPSGESLKTMEGPLVKKVKDRLARFSPTWKRVIAFLYLLKTGKKLDIKDITLSWADPETVQPQQAAQTKQAEAAAIAARLPLGVSNQQGLREMGYNDDLIEKMQTERSEWAEAQSGTIEAVRLELETARAQLGLLLAQAAIQRGQIGVTAGQLLKELGYTEQEIKLMLGDAASEPPAPTKGGAAIATAPAQRATAALVKAIAPGADGGATAQAAASTASPNRAATQSRNGTATDKNNARNE